MTADRTDPGAYGDLDAIVAALSPEHVRTRRSPVLEEDAPAAMRALWSGLGTSAATAVYGIGLLTRAQSRERIEEIFEDWSAGPRIRAAWGVGTGTAGFWGLLPPRVRLVAHEWSRHAEEFAFTDESGAADPPVLVMRRGRPPVLRWHDSYVQWYLWHLLGRLAGYRYAGYQVRSGLRGVPRLAGVLAGLEELGPGVWLCSAPEFVRPDVTVSPHDVLYRSVADYVRFVLGQPDDTVVYCERFHGSEAFVARPGELDLWTGTAPAGFRVFTPETTTKMVWRRAIGRIGDADVWLDQAEHTELIVTYDPAQDATVRDWLSGLGLPATWQPLPDTPDPG